MIVAVLGGSLAGLHASGADKDTLRVFMRAKLEHSQKILEGLTTDDLASVAKHSQELSLLSHASNWEVLQTEDYVQHSREFRRTTDTLTKAAREKNLDGATLAYLSMTMSCVNCHKYVRGVRMADAGAPGLDDLGLLLRKGQPGTQLIDHRSDLHADLGRSVDADVR
jgi:hypothetical protein